MGYQAAPDGSLVLTCGLHQFMSNTEDKALLFGSKWLVYPAFGSPPAPTTHPTHPPPIDSIRDITGAEKNYLKNQVASRISYERIATYITTLFIQDIWRDCIIPQEK